ncbi:MAG TPA: adenine phosphoribosyltransferase [Gemmatimonadaceae bacterium]|nr:adenine phosphoribosyltransferase [Gemmatimonadaceae bacterium]
MTQHGDDSQAQLRALIREVPDFPKPGINFRDITPLLGSPTHFTMAITGMLPPWRESGITHVVGVESRGFIFGAPIALALGAGFVPVRKPGKLPHTVLRESYALEYGTDSLEMHSDALPPGARVLVVDDVLATGGTACATARLVRRAGGTLEGFAFLIEITALGGRDGLGDARIASSFAY